MGVRSGQAARRCRSGFAWVFGVVFGLVPLRMARRRRLVRHLRRRLRAGRFGLRGRRGAVRRQGRCGGALGLVLRCFLRLLALGLQGLFALSALGLLLFALAAQLLCLALGIRRC